MQIRPWKNSTFLANQPSLFTGCWEYLLNEGEQTIPHSHESGEEINMILEGSGIVTVGGVSREVSQGEVVFIPHKTQHSITNPNESTLRGLTVEATVPFTTTGNDDKVTMKDLEEVIDSIPSDVSAPEALQLIIRLFDLAGYLSEQIEDAIGLDSETGVDALANIENRVMDAVVRISASYEDDRPPAPFDRRF